MSEQTCNSCEHWLRITHWGVCRAILNVAEYPLQTPEVPAAILNQPMRGEPHGLSTSPKFGCVLWKEREIPYD